MTHTARRHEFAYEQTDIPPGMTVRDWRIHRARTRATSRHWSRIIGALRRSARRRRGTVAEQRGGRRARDKRSVELHGTR
jgi:hypothetical protein